MFYPDSVCWLWPWYTNIKLPSAMYIYILGAFISTRKNKWNQIDLTFSQDNMTNVYEYPKFDLATPFSAIGGGMGLRLGLGITQLLEMGRHLWSYLVKPVKY